MKPLVQKQNKTFLPSQAEPCNFSPVTVTTSHQESETTPLAPPRSL